MVSDRSKHVRTRWVLHIGIQLAVSVSAIIPKSVKMWPAPAVIFHALINRENPKKSKFLVSI